MANLFAMKNLRGSIRLSHGALLYTDYFFLLSESLSSLSYNRTVLHYFPTGKSVVLFLHL